MRSETEKRGIKNPKTHIYTGDGKGKTTAALGMAMRAAGQGLSVVIIQFLKDTFTGELATAMHIPNLKILRFQEGEKGFLFQMNEEQKKTLMCETNEAFSYAEQLMDEKACDLLILDEILGCLSCGLIELSRLLQLVQNKTAELILTGRDAPGELLAVADYVSEIHNVKHPFQQKLPPRKGIEF